MSRLVLMVSILTLGLTAGSTWAVEEFKITADDAAAGDQFGFSVSISGDYAIVGAYFNDDDSVSSGSAYIYSFNPDIVELHENRLPTEFSLSQPYPNPFNAVTRIAYAVPKDSHVKLAVYDISGRMVGLLIDENVSAGRHVCEFDGSDIAAGLYFVRMEARGNVLIRKAVVVK